MPYTIGLVEGFQGAREANILQQQKDDAGRREQEGKIYQYLLQSQDPDMRALAISGLFESAMPGQKGGGLAGYLGKLQGGQVYPQVRARMEEMIPAEPSPTGAPAAPAAPGSAGMSTNQTTRPGSAPINPNPAGARGGAEMPGIPMPPEAPPAGVGPAANDGGAAAGPNMGAGPIGIPPPVAPPVSQFKRRGTGVPTAEEIAENTSRIEFESKVKTISTAILANGGTAEDVKRAVLGMAGAPQGRNATVAGPMMADPADLKTPIPTVREQLPDGSFRVTLIDGTPVPPQLVGYAKPTGQGGGLTQYVRSTPETDRKYGQAGPSPTGYWHVKELPDGTFQAEAGEYTPPPNFAGTATIGDANGNPIVATIPRTGGPPGPSNVLGPGVGGGPTAEQSDASALLATVDKAITDAETPRFAGAPKKPLTPQQKDQLVKQYATQGGMPYTSYLEVQQAARQQRRPSVTPTTPKPAGTPGGGGSALSMADQVRADLLTRQKAAGAAPAPATVPPPPPAPPR